MSGVWPLTPLNAANRLTQAGGDGAIKPDG